MFSFLLHTILLPLSGSFTCAEWGNCTITGGNLFNIVMMPYQWSLGDLAPVAIWGILIGIIWQRSHNMMLVGIIGIAINASMILYNPAIRTAWFLLAIAVGVTLFQLVTLRPHGGSTN
jgi:hypothetical protein